jgi:hypothetical protein
MRLAAEHSRTHGLDTACKRLLVGICGKFGQRDREWVDCPEYTPLEPYGEWYSLDPNNNSVRYRSIGWRVQRELVRGYSADANPAIAGWITSAGRRLLLFYIRIAGWENVLYCDTDSLMVNVAGFLRLRDKGYVHDKVLGMLYQKYVADQLTIYAPKHYQEDGRLVQAGEQKPTHVDGDGNPAYWQYSTPLDSIRSGIRPEYWRVSCSATLTNTPAKQP